jgi:DNA-binding SARP family transcriptional activator
MTLPLIRPRAPTEIRSTNNLCLFGGPYVTIGGRRLEVPEGSKRLLVFVTLLGGRVNRRHAAGTLWPYGDDGRAAGNLRSALWRLKGAGIDILRADKCTLHLDPDVKVDVIELTEWADRIIEGRILPLDLRVIQLSPEAVDLLPGWYDDWVVFERERVRQRLLHALESLSRRFVAESRFADAVEVAMTAVSVEPLRESAQRVLIESHLAEQNWIEARRSFATYARLLYDELGVMPSEELTAFVRSETRSTSADLPSQHSDGLHPQTAGGLRGMRTRFGFGSTNGLNGSLGRPVDSAR